jgi:hypothetical protein
MLALQIALFAFWRVELHSTTLGPTCLLRSRQKLIFSWQPGVAELGSFLSGWRQLGHVPISMQAPAELYIPMRPRSHRA